MSVKMSKSAMDSESHNSDNPALAAVEAWLMFNRPMLNAWSEINGRLIEQATKANNEWLSFLGRRMNEDIVLSKRFLECKTLQDVTALYSEFFQRAQKQYQDEFQHFARLNQQLADETASMVRSHFDEAAAEIRH